MKQITTIQIQEPKLIPTTQGIISDFILMAILDHQDLDII